MGGKKGGGSRTPIEAKETGRSFQILRILEVISEGEIYGLVDDMKSVYLDKTPLCNKDGSFNFKNVSIYANAGTQDQTPLNEFTSVEKEIDVGAKILLDKPVTKTIVDEYVTRVRMTVGVERLSRTEDNGDTNPSSVTFKITLLKNNVIHSERDYIISGKYSNPYREMLMLDNLPQAPFEIKVARTTKESTSNKHQDGMFWGSYTEIIDEEFAYPNTALVGIKIDSEYFHNAPTRNYEVYGLIMKVPTIYDAFNHTYTSDFWNGEFKLSWTNNPAWVLYDLVTNTRYGMGMRLADFGIDKWQLYAIGRYCDELVPDGYGGTEPRMTCNAWITDQRKAYDLIMDLCSIFRGMPVWNGQALTAIQDRASDPVWTYNNSNVIGGFKRQRSARKARHNSIEVQYIDKDDFYEKKVESVSDDALIARYGRNVKKITAFGCTSRGQAYRTGKWLLETEKLETETITFTVGQEGVMHLPYDVIEVADSDYAGVNIGGRILEVNGNKVKLDGTIEIDDKSYLSYVSSEGKTDNVKIVSFDSETNIATLAKNVTGTPQYSVWALTTKRISTGLYRAISIKENDSQSGKTYTITALQHVPEKEDIVTNGTYFEPKPLTKYTEVTSIDVAYDGRKITFNGKVSEHGNGLLSNNATNYTLRLTKNGSLVYIKKGLTTPDLEIDDLENGEYYVTISAYNERGQLLSTKEKSFTINRPPLVSNVSLQAHFTSVWLEWDYVDSITETEIWANTVNDINSSELITTVNAIRYSHEIGGEETRYYWLRHKRGINLGLFDQVDGRVCTTDKDLNKTLTELNENLKENIVDEIIDTALPARKLELTLTVSSLENPTEFLNHKQVYNEADGKLWVWNNSKKRYEADSKEILASAIKGIIQPNQLASIPTSKINGKITNEMLQFVSADKITGTINIHQLANIPTTKLTGQITANQLAVNSVGANVIQAGVIGSQHIRANSIGSEKIQANAIGTNALQANAVGADKIQANAVTSAKIMAGAVNADHLQAGQISADKLAIGLGGNLLYNPIFANNGEGWHLDVDTGNMPNTGWDFNRNTGDYQGDAYVDTENQFRWQENRKNTNGGNVRLGGLYHDMKLAKGKYYIFSAYVGGHRAYIDLNIEQSTIEPIFKSWSGRGVTGGYGSGSTKQTGIEEERRIFIVFKANGNVDSNYRLIINMWAYGSERNAFVAIRRPMLEECTVHARKPSVWVNAGVTSIHGGSIKTRTITADHLQANTITGNEIASNAIQTKHIATNSIASNHIASRTITADKLNVVNLSAVSSNIGNITAGSIRGVHLEGNTINGNIINGNTITGGSITGTTITGTTISGGVINGATIRGSTIEGVTVQAENIIGDIVKIYIVNQNSSVDIPAANFSRKIISMPFSASVYRSPDYSQAERNRSTKHFNITLAVNNRPIFDWNTRFGSLDNKMVDSILPKSENIKLTYSTKNAGGQKGELKITDKIFFLVTKI